MESYALAHLFAGYCTSIDCWEKRKQKGFLFTIGDEPIHRNYSRVDIQNITGNGDIGDQTAIDLIEKAKETYNVFHVALGSHFNISYWRELLGENVLDVENYKEIPSLIAHTINKNLGKQTTTPVKEVEVKETKQEDIEVL